MRSYRENPDSEANQSATKQHQREVFAAKMQHQAESESPLEDHLDLMVDEFERIKALVPTAIRVAYGGEIIGICERAVNQTEQRVPVIAQLRAANTTIATLTKSLEEIAKSLGITQCDPIKSESNDLFHHKGRGFLLRDELPSRCIEVIQNTERSLEEAKCGEQKLSAALWRIRDFLDDPSDDTPEAVEKVVGAMAERVLVADTNLKAAKKWMDHLPDCEQAIATEECDCCTCGLDVFRSTLGGAKKEAVTVEDDWKKEASYILKHAWFTCNCGQRYGKDHNEHISSCQIYLGERAEKLLNPKKAPTP